MSFRHKEEISDTKVAEHFFPKRGTEVQRPEQVPASGNWNRRIVYAEKSVSASCE